MCKYLEINNILNIFSLLLLTLNAPLHVGKCTPWGAYTPGWQLQCEIKSIAFLQSSWLKSF